MSAYAHGPQVVPLLLGELLRSSQSSFHSFFFALNLSGLRQRWIILGGK